MPVYITMILIHRLDFKQFIPAEIEYLHMDTYKNNILQHENLNLAVSVGPKIKYVNLCLMLISKWNSKINI